MERSDREWLVPLISGLGFIVLLIVSFIVTGSAEGRR